MAKCGTAVLILLFIILLGMSSALKEGREKASRTEAVLKELVSFWRNGRRWYSHRELHPSVRVQDNQLHSVVKNIVGGLKTLGILPQKSMKLPSLTESLDKNRLSSFLHNISTYLQGAGEDKDRPQSTNQDQFWEKVLYTLLQIDGDSSYGYWDEKGPPRPSFRLLDLFLSLRGSTHWNSLLGLVQAIVSLSEQQSHRSLLTFLSQNWKIISALLDATIQTLLSGTYGQANAGIQGFICVLKGREDCTFNVDWLQQLMSFLETQNWKPVINFHPGIAGENPASSLFGRFKPFSMLPGAFKDSVIANQMPPNTADMDSVQTLLLQALSRSNSGEQSGRLLKPNPALLQGLDGLRRGLLHKVGSSVYGSLRRKVSRVTVALLDEVISLVGMPQAKRQGKCSVGKGIRHNLTWNAQDLGFGSQGPPNRPHLMSCTSSGDRDRYSKTSNLPSKKHTFSKPHLRTAGDAKPRNSGYAASLEILEAACNDSIPGLTGVSNFTVFLYCNLFDGSDDALNSEMVHMEQDLHSTCSDAAWYLSAAEDDFLWVHVCSEFFAHEFNNTICANSSFWLQLAHMASLTKDYHYLNRSSIDDLCMHLSSNVNRGSGLDPSEDCLAQLGARSLSAQDFWQCFLPNNSALITSLCGNDSSPVYHESGWAAEYCSKIHNSSTHLPRNEPCDYKHWEVQHLANSTLLQLCAHTGGLKDHICQNATLFRQLSMTNTWVLDFCTDPEAKSEAGKCFLQQVFDMLPARYDFDTSQLCVNPAPFLLEALYRLSQCEGDVDERVGWLGMVSYVLRILDFVVGLSAGLEEGEGEVRQGLAQAILLSSLLDNASFWATLQPNASLSVLHTVGVFLRKEQDPLLKEDLLSCFSPVLWDLIQREDNSSALRVLFQEYLQMPQESIRTLLMSAEKDAVKRFLSHMHQSWSQLQVETAQASQKEQRAMETMTSAFIHKFSRVTPDLFVDLSQFIPFMSVSDIMTFPTSLMVNDSVLMAIRDHSSEMKSPQKRAFIKRLLQSKMVDEVPSWPPYFLSSILPLLPYLPVCYFQRLTSQQLGPLVGVLGNSSLDATRGRHVLRSVFGKKKNITNDELIQMGALVCYLNPDELHQLLLASSLSQPLWQQLAMCISEGRASSTGRLAHWLAIAVTPLNISTLPWSAVTSLRGLLPRLGASFLQPFTTPQLLDVLTQPGLPSYTPAQAFRILTKLTQDANLRLDALCRLQPLLLGISPSILKALSGPILGEPTYCQCWTSLLSELQPAQKAILHSRLQEALERISGNMTVQLQCLLPFVPLKTLRSALDGSEILRHITVLKHLPWSSQQAQLLYKKIFPTENITVESMKILGRIATGVNCDSLRLLSNKSDFSEVLQWISKLPGGVTPALRKCVMEELQKRPQMDLNILSPSFITELPVKMVESLSNTSFVAVLDYIRQNVIDFLQLPQHKKEALTEKAVSILGVSKEGSITGATLDRLGPLMAFLDQNIFGRVEREALRLRLDEIKGFCLPQGTIEEIGRILTEKDMLGEPAFWTVEDVEHAGRLVFALPSKQIGSVSLDVLSADTVEEVLENQRSWEDSVVGRTCEHLPGLGEKKKTLLQGIIQGRGRKRKEPTPSCADVKGTFPSAWRAVQLRRMGEGELSLCLEDLSYDDSLSSEQRHTLWSRLRQTYGAVKNLTPEQILELGCLVTEMSERELHDINLADLGIVAHLGSLKGWSPRKIRAAMLSFLRHSSLKLEELGETELASLGHLLCGLSPAEIAHLNSKKLSLAVLFLRELALPCTEQQGEALATLLFQPQAFGPVSDWGSHVFTEIGTLAAGLPDIVMSSLVREQIEGLTPEAIALIPPRKMAVVFSAAQLSWLTAEQASRVTKEQWDELSSEQIRALSLALYEGELLLEHRGKNSAPLSWSPSCLTVWLFCLSSML
ncbi:stereocilin-like [Arapaima gigas]